ncbi:MAG: tRNA (adenosine(37)-N6)-threonylcarbamoyltransferase complex dimerization subunit type 1 TsaB [Acidobacteria bacterium]|nr:tRNA (adenosine(37)-N6)-threonylcarbamoyltransferase complex dimerization subunit type 1 TsaB [Acidobacteriota bacterium]
MRKAERSPTVLLAIDTTSADQGLAVLSDGRVAGVQVIRPGASNTETLTENLGRLLSATGFGAPSLSRVAVVTGPGSFSGIRIGMAVAAGLADALDLPVAGFNSLELMAFHPLVPDGFLCPLVNAHRGNVYAATYNRAGPLCSEETAPAEMTPSDFDALLTRVESSGEPFNALGDTDTLPPEFAQIARRHRSRILRTCVPLCVLLAQAAARFPDRAAPGRTMPEAFYIRPPDIRRKPASPTKTG